MAEARSGTQQPSLTLQAGLNVTPLVDFAHATRRSLIRNSFRVRNRIRDNLWPLSAWYLTLLMLALTALVIEETHCPLFLLVAFVYAQNFLQLDNAVDDVIHFSRPTQVVICATVCGVTTIVCMALVRQMALKCLLTWKGWLYQEPGKKGSVWLFLWGMVVRLFSGPSPSLYSFQRCLPRLPVPPLSSTVTKFLASMKPVLPVEEYDALVAKAKEFEHGTGVQLQRILYLKSWWASNYVSDWWLQYVYLMGRSSIALNSNYYAVDQCKFLPTANREARAAGMVWLTANFYDQIEREEMKPIRINNLIPLCMEQYHRVLANTRIPGKEMDQLRQAEKSKHVVIFYNGVFHRLDLYDRQRRRLSPLELQYQIEAIVQAVNDIPADENSKAESHIAALTGAERGTWYEARQSMMQNPDNMTSLSEIESSMILVSLSEETPSTYSERCRTAFHGTGDNIWYDKSVSLAAYKNGRVSLNVEHSWGDAPVVGHLMECLFPPEYELALYKPDGSCAARCETDRIPWHKRREQLRRPQRLSWNLTPDVEKTVMESYTSLRNLMPECMFEMFVFDDFGKKYITRTGKFSPDSFIQMVLQAAYFRESGKFTLTYEAAMTRLFRNGRTETIRTVSDLSCRAVREMEGKALSAKEKHQLLQQACRQHQHVSRDAMAGQGVDRHLFALYVVCKGLGQDSEFLKKALGYPWTLSTSQQPIQQIPKPWSLDDPVVKPQIPLAGGFMAVADDGYGVSYQVVGQSRLHFHVSSAKKSAGKTDAIRFAGHIQQVLSDWKAIIDEAGQN